MRFKNALGYVCLLLGISACASSSQATPSNTATQTQVIPSSTATQTLPTPTKVEEITFTLTLGGEHRDRGINLLQTRDGGYAIIGYTSNVGASKEDVYLVRTDSRGEVLWTKTYGGDGQDNGWAILETEDGGFVLFGFTSSFGAEVDMYLVRVDAQGDLLWERTFGGPKSEYGWAMAPTSDGGYVLAGQTNSFGEGDKDGYLVKVNDQGEEIWSQTYGGPREDRLYAIDQGSDGGFVLTGTTTSFGAGNRDVYLVKTNSVGDLDWTQVFGEDRDDVGHSVRQTADGGYIVIGYTKSFDAQSYDTWLIKTDAAGVQQWQKFYGGENDDRAIYGEQTADGGYILTGYTKSFGVAGWDVLLVRADASGDVTWHKTFGGNANDTGYTVRQTSDKGFVLTGETYSFGEGGGDMYVIKVDQQGETTE